MYLRDASTSRTQARSNDNHQSDVEKSRWRLYRETVYKLVLKKRVERQAFANLLAMQQVPPHITARTCLLLI